MPYKLKKARNKPLYWVITIETGKKHSKDPIPMEKAKAQLRILKSALKKGGADQDFDPEMAGLMGEPVQFAPIAAPIPNPFAGLFEPRPIRRRRQANKRAVSTVQGAIVTGDEKRKKTQGEYRGQGSRKKRGGSYEKLITTRMAANPSRTRNYVRDVIAAQGYTEMFVNVGALPAAGIQNITIPQRNNILRALNIIAAIELANGIITQEEHDLFNPPPAAGAPGSGPSGQNPTNSGNGNRKGRCIKCGLPR